MASVAIIGATGYGGVELIRLLHSHPEIELSYLSSDTYAGKRLSEVYPHLATVDLPLEKRDPAAAARCDFVLSAVPAGVPMGFVPDLLAAGARVVDVSPDFRLKDATLYPRWYKFDHACPELLEEAVFGIPELHREEIASAKLVAAAGCYPTGALLGLAPLVAEGLVEPDDIIVDGKTGVSGAGRTSLRVEYHFPEAEADVAAYAVGGHRHMPEMVQELSALTDAEVKITFTPHLVPMSRGILSTMSAMTKGGVGTAELRDCLQRCYEDEPFVHVLPEGQWPHTKWTTGTNYCFLAVGTDQSTGRALVVSVLDNLGKGMAGQMVQCLNLMMGVDEQTALRIPAAYP